MENIRQTIQLAVGALAHERVTRLAMVGHRGHGSQLN
jgi:hypothetical protein